MGVLVRGRWNGFVPGRDGPLAFAASFEEGLRDALSERKSFSGVTRSRTAGGDGDLSVYSGLA